MEVLKGARRKAWWEAPPSRSVHCLRHPAFIILPRARGRVKIVGILKGARRVTRSSSPHLELRVGGQIQMAWREAVPSERPNRIISALRGWMSRIGWRISTRNERVRPTSFLPLFLVGRRLGDRVAR